MDIERLSEVNIEVLVRFLFIPMTDRRMKWGADRSCAHGVQMYP